MPEISEEKAINILKVLYQCWADQEGIKIKELSVTNTKTGKTTIIDKF